VKNLQSKSFQSFSEHLKWKKKDFKEKNKVEGTSNSQSEIKNKPLLEMSSRRRWAVTVGVMTGMFIAALEATVVGTAMTVGGLNHYSWVFSAYLVTSTVEV
jgi:hypothetical protein